MSQTGTPTLLDRIRKVREQQEAAPPAPATLKDRIRAVRARQGATPDVAPGPVVAPPATPDVAAPPRTTQAWQDTYARTAQAVQNPAPVGPAGDPTVTGELPVPLGAALGVARGGVRIAESVPRTVEMLQRVPGQFVQTAGDLISRAVGDGPLPQGIGQQIMAPSEGAANIAKALADPLGRAADAIPKSPSAQGLQPGKLAWWTENLAEQVPQYGMAIASGGLAAMAGSGKLAQIAAATLPTFGMEASEAYQQTGSPMVGIGVGLVNTALESIPMAEMFTASPTGRAILRKVGIAAAPRFVERAISVGPAEAVTEMAQEVTQMLGQYAAGDPAAFADWKSRVGASGLLGAAGGAGMAVAFPGGVANQPGAAPGATATPTGMGQAPTMPQDATGEPGTQGTTQAPPTPPAQPNAAATAPGQAPGSAQAPTGPVKVQPPGVQPEPDWAQGLSIEQLRQMAVEVGARNRGGRQQLIQQIAQKRPAAPLTPPEAGLPQWAKDEIDTRNAFVEKRGLADKVEELSAQRLTARQVARQLGIEAADVYAVRSRRRIPSMDSPAEFEAWLSGRDQARAADPGLSEKVRGEIAATMERLRGSAVEAAEAPAEPHTASQTPSPNVDEVQAGNEPAAQAPEPRPADARENEGPPLAGGESAVPGPVSLPDHLEDDTSPSAEAAPEQIADVAIRLDDGTILTSGNRPHGTIDIPPGRTAAEDGFTTTSGRFVGRQEALAIATRANQAKTEDEAPDPKFGLGAADVETFAPRAEAGAPTTPPQERANAQQEEGQGNEEGLLSPAAAKPEGDAADSGLSVAIKRPSKPKAARFMRTPDLVAELEAAGVEVPNGVKTPRKELVSGVENLRAGRVEAVDDGVRDPAQERPVEGGPDVPVPAREVDAAVAPVVGDQGAPAGAEPGDVGGEVEAAKPAAEPHKFSTTQFDLPEEIAAKVRAVAARIPDEDLAPDGRENAPHLTVKYGLTVDDAQKVREALQGQGPVRVVLGETSLFENDEHDVVKVDVKGPALHALNKRIADAVPNQDTQPTYIPHVTIAYVKKGRGKQYAGKTFLKGQSIRIDRITFSDREGKRTEIGLGAAEEAAPTQQMQPIWPPAARPQTVTGSRPPLPQKSVDLINKAIDEKDIKTLLAPTWALDPANKGMRAIFTERTGVKLPGTIKGTQQAVHLWMAKKTTDHQWKEIGTNADGHKVYEDAKGVRSYVESGVRVTEAVGIRPGGGLALPDPEKRGSDFLPVEQETFPDLTVTGQQKPVPGRDGASYVVHRRKPDMIPDTFKVVMQRQSPWLSVHGTGMSAEEAYKNAVANLDEKVREAKLAAAEKPKDTTLEDAARGRAAGTQIIRSQLEGYIRDNLKDARGTAKDGIQSALMDFQRGDFEAAAMLLRRVGRIDGGEVGRRAESQARSIDELAKRIAEGKPAAVETGEADPSPAATWDAMDYGQRQEVANRSTYKDSRKIVHRIAGSKWAQLGPGEQAEIEKAMGAGAKPAGILGALSAEKQARAAELKKRLAGKLNNELRSGFDPEMLAIGAELSALYVEAGARRFGAFAKAMVGDLGEKVKPYLKSFYLAACNMPGVDAKDMDKASYVDGMDDAELDRIVSGQAEYEENTLPATLREIAQSITDDDKRENLEDWAKGIAEGRTTGDDLRSVASGYHMQAFGVDAGHRILEAIDKGMSAGKPQPSDKASATASDAPAVALAKDVARLLESNQKITPAMLFSAAKDRYGGSLSEGKFSAKDAYDAAELGINLWIRDHPETIDPTHGIVRARNAQQVLASKTQQLPTQTRRDAETDSMQQFSTPPEYAYAVNWAANIRPGETVLEPSAGTGSIAVHAINAGARVVGNELAPDRAALLKQLGADQVFTENAEQISKIIKVQPTVVVMNPPFSQTAGRMGNKMQPMTGANHIEEAMRLLKPGGRLVAIVGRGMSPDAPTFRAWFNRIGKQNAIRANVGVSGDVYKKYGTAFATRLLVIDKTAPDGTPIVTGDVGSIRELLDTLIGVRNGRTLPESVGAESGGSQAADRSEAEARPHAPVHAPTDAVGAGSGRGDGGTGVQPSARGQPRSDAEAVGSGQGVSVSPGERGRGQSASGVGPARKDAGEGRGDASGRAERPPEGDGAGVQPAASAGLTLETPATDEAAEAGELRSSVYEKYKPKKVKIAGAKPHPTALVESAAMAAVDLPTPTYSPSIPAGVVKEGGLSDAQLEAIVYAGQAHGQDLPNGHRKGHFIGDGTGVGKGREIAGIILDNLNKGRKKHIWVSERPDLIESAKRDFKGVGGDESLLIPINKIGAREKIKNNTGVLFVGYGTLRSASKGQGGAEGVRRLQQILDWAGPDFDGVIAFDEAHNMANAVVIQEEGRRGTASVSQTAEAGLALANRLPRARVEYVSATGATEVRNLAYADRLGLWGAGTAFPTKQDFISKVSSGGIAAMELVARDMKAMGLYLARNQAFDGVEQTKVVHDLTEDQERVYNELADAWALVYRNVEAALGLVASSQNADGETRIDSKAKAAALSQFYGTQQRFWNQVLTAMQMPTVISSIEEDLKAGHAAVLQIVNTDEAAQTRALNAMQEGDSIEDLDLTPRQQLMNYIESGFPVNQQEVYINEETGQESMRPVRDAQGNYVTNPEAVALREALLDRLGSIRVPDGPLDTLLEHFGPDQVAEITGRKERRERVRDNDGNETVKMVKRRAGSNLTEEKAFRDDKKRVLIFSQAGGTGSSYHADRTFVNQRKRMHYLVQAGWRADKAVQGLGRTKRTNEAQPPEYKLVSTNIPGHKRFISTIARRLDQLGALTKGQRQTGGQGLFSSTDNLESQYATAALQRLYRDIAAGRVRTMPLESFESATGLRLTDRNGSVLQQLPPIGRFLNRVLSMRVDAQNTLFKEFNDRMEENIRRAEEDGTLDRGVETYTADSIEKDSEDVIHTDPSGATTKIVKLTVQNKADKLTLDELRKKIGVAGYIVRNTRSDNVVAISGKVTTRTTDGNTVEGRTVYLPNGKSRFASMKAIDENSQTLGGIDSDEGKAAWEAALAELPDFTNETVHVITGAILPIWDRLSGPTRVWRFQTNAGERMLGRLVPEDEVQRTLARFGVNRKGWVPESAEEAAKAVLERGYALNLSNGWTIRKANVAGEDRIELVGPDYQYTSELSQAGVFSERHQYKTRYFIPAGDRAAEVIGAVIKHREIIEAVAPPKKSLTDRIIAATEDIEATARENLRRNQLPRDGRAGGGTIHYDIAQVGIIVSARVVRFGARRMANVNKAVAAVLAELKRADLAKYTKDIGRVARRLARRARGEDGVFDQGRYERAVDAEQERLKTDLAPTKKIVAENTGAGAREPKTIGAAEALVRGLRREERAARQSYRLAQAEARNRIVVLTQDLQREIRSAGLEGAIREREKGRVEGEKQKTRDEMREEALQLVRRHAPMAVRGRLLEAVTRAITPQRLLVVAQRLRREVGIHDVRVLLRKAAKIPADALRTLEPELRADADAAMGTIARNQAAYDAIRATTPTADIEVMREELGAAIKAVRAALFEQKNLDTVRIKGEAVQSATIRAELMDSLAKYKGLPEPEDGDKDVGVVRRQLRRRTNWEYLMRSLDGFKPGAGHRLWGEILRSRRESLRLHHQFEDGLSEIVRRHGFGSMGAFQAALSGTMGRASQQRVDVSIGGRSSITLGQAAYLYAASTDTGFRARLRAGQTMQFGENATGSAFTVSDRDLARVEAAIPENVRKIIDEAKALYDRTYFERMSRVNKRLKGYFLDKVPGYWGIKLNRQYSETAGVPSSWRGAFIRAQEESGFMQDRTGPSKTPMLLGDFGKDIINRSRGASTTIGKAEPVRMLARTLLHPEIQTAITDNLGASEVRRLKRRISMFSGGDMFNMADARTMRAVQSLWARGKTQLWAPTWARNALAGSMRVLNDLGPAAVARGMTPSFEKPTWAEFKELVDLSPELRERWSGHAIASFYDPMGTHGEEARFREAMGAGLRQLGQIISEVTSMSPARATKAAMEMGKPWRAMLDAMTIGNYFDAIPAVVAYRHFKRVAPQNLSADGQRRWAARHATRVFERVSNTATMEYANDVQLDARESFAVAMFITFTGDTAKAQNMMAEAASKGPTALARTTATLALSASLSALVSAAWSGLSGDDEDKVKRAGLARLMQELTGLFPFVGIPLAKLIGNKVYGSKMLGGKSQPIPEIEAPIVELVNIAVRMADNTIRAIERMDGPVGRQKLTSADFVRKVGADATELAGSSLGLPIQYLRTIKTAIDKWSEAATPR